MTWSVFLKAVIRGQTEGQFRRSLSRSSSLKMRLGEDVT